MYTVRRQCLGCALLFLSPVTRDACSRQTTPSIRRHDHRGWRTGWRRRRHPQAPGNTACPDPGVPSLPHFTPQGLRVDVGLNYKSTVYAVPALCYTDIVGGGSRRISVVNTDGKVCTRSKAQPRAKPTGTRQMPAPGALATRSRAGAIVVEQPSQPPSPHGTLLYDDTQTDCAPYLYCTKHRV